MKRGRFARPRLWVGEWMIRRPCSGFCEADHTRHKFPLIARPGRGSVPPRGPHRTCRAGSRGQRAGMRPTPTSSRTSICSCGRNRRGRRREKERRVRTSRSETCECPFVRVEVACPEPGERVGRGCSSCDTPSIDNLGSAVCEMAHQEVKSNRRCLTDVEWLARPRSSL